MVCMVNATAVHEISEKSDIPHFRPGPVNPQCHRIQVNETKAALRGYKVNPGIPERLKTPKIPGNFCLVHGGASFAIFIGILWKFTHHVFPWILN